MDDIGISNRLFRLDLHSWNREHCNLGFDVQGKPLEKLSPLEYINMEGECDFEVEYSTEELVQLVQHG